MRLIAFIAIMLLTPMAAFALPDDQVVREAAKQTNLTRGEIWKDFDSCESRHMRARMICASYRLAEQDIKLNKAYEKALAQSHLKSKIPTLRKAQRAWLQFRDSQCSLEGEVTIGEYNEDWLRMTFCKEQLTAQQATRLEALARDK